MKHFSFKKIIGCAGLVCILLGGGIRFAQAKIPSYTLLEPLPCTGLVTENCNGGVIKDIVVDSFLKYVYLLMLSLGAVLSVIMIIWAGFQYITSEIVDTKSEAKKRAQNAVLGLILMLSTYLILDTINPKLVDVKYTLPTIESTGAGMKALDDILASTGDRSRLLEEQIHKDQARIKEQNDQLKKIKDKIAALDQSPDANNMDEKIDLEEEARDLEIKIKVDTFQSSEESIYQKQLNVLRTSASNKEAKNDYNNLLSSIDENAEKYVKDLTDLGASDEANKVKKSYQTYYREKAAMEAATQAVIQAIEVHSGGRGVLGDIISPAVGAVNTARNYSDQLTHDFNLQQAKNLLAALQKGQGESPVNPTDIIVRTGIFDEKLTRFQSKPVLYPQDPTLAARLKQDKQGFIESLQKTIDRNSAKK